MPFSRGGWDRVDPVIEFFSSCAATLRFWAWLPCNFWVCIATVCCFGSLNPTWSLACSWFFSWHECCPFFENVLNTKNHQIWSFALNYNTSIEKHPYIVYLAPFNISLDILTWIRTSLFDRAINPLLCFSLKTRCRWDSSSHL